MKPVELKDFCIHLRDRITFNKCDFSIEAGSASVIMGPTGTGKSVFLKSIAGILPMHIFKFEGSMKVNGIDAYIDGENWDLISGLRLNSQALCLFLQKLRR